MSLVEFAFNSARQGDLFIRKAKACKIGDLAQAILNLFQSDSRITVIGTRHAEKLSEALASREELARAEDMGEYFRIQADNRDLNYSIYTDLGNVKQQSFDDYDSHTVDHLTISEVEELLLTLPEVRQELKLAGISAGND